MEIVGLLVIVILIVLIIFFSLSFKANKSDDKSIIPYQDMKYATQMGISISETTINCNSNYIEINELVKYCALKTNNCGQYDACELLNDTIDKILEQTLRIDLEHNLIINFGGEPITNFITNGCINPRKVEATPPTIIPLGNGLAATLTVRICK